MTNKTWQLVVDESSADERRRTFKLRVPGGWLYRYELNEPISNDARQPPQSRRRVLRPRKTNQQPWDCLASRLLPPSIGLTYIEHVPLVYAQKTHRQQLVV
jgi:hypothetical protein